MESDSIIWVVIGICHHRQKNSHLKEWLFYKILACATIVLSGSNTTNIEIENVIGVCRCHPNHTPVDIAACG